MGKKETVRHVKGMNDIHPHASDAFLRTHVWQHMLRVSEVCLRQFGFDRVWLPVVEHTQLLTRGIGEQTDIVSKEMYTFEDRGGRSLT